MNHPDKEDYKQMFFFMAIVLVTLLSVKIALWLFM
jgi:hypothetical protein